LIRIIRDFHLRALKLEIAAVAVELLYELHLARNTYRPRRSTSSMESSKRFRDGHHIADCRVELESCDLGCGIEEEEEEEVESFPWDSPLDVSNVYAEDDKTYIASFTEYKLLALDKGVFCVREEPDGDGNVLRVYSMQKYNFAGKPTAEIPVLMHYADRAEGASNARCNCNFSTRTRSLIDGHSGVSGCEFNVCHHERLFQDLVTSNTLRSKKCSRPDVVQVDGAYFIILSVPSSAHAECTDAPTKNAAADHNATANASEPS
jgi:hypothetical protein